MSRAKYPAEAVAFEVVGGEGAHGFAIASVVEGCAIDKPFLVCTGEIVETGYGVVGGDREQFMRPEQLRPLTRAAREMLALVRP